MFNKSFYEIMIQFFNALTTYFFKDIRKLCKKCLIKKIKNDTFMAPRTNGRHVTQSWNQKLSKLCAMFGVNAGVNDAIAAPAEKFRAKNDANLSDAKAVAKHGANTNYYHTKYGAIRTWRLECVMDFCGID